MRNTEREPKMPNKVITNTKVVISGEGLLHRWTGLTENDLAYYIDKSNADYGDDKPPAKIAKFPQAYIPLERHKKSETSEEFSTKRVSCRPDYANGEEYKRPYAWTGLSKHKGRQYDFSGICFRLCDVEAYEKKYPKMKWIVVDPEDIPFVRSDKQQQDIDKLERKIVRLTEENEELTVQLAQAAADSPTLVKADKWKGSVQAAFTLIVEIMSRDKHDWKREEFQKRMNELYSDYLSQVEAIAWKALPTNPFKGGPGRPPKTPKTSNTPE